MDIRVGSLFSGIGGLDLGLERAGMKIVWQVENDPFCQKVLKKHWPEVPCYGDIKEIDFTTLPPVDLICGGFPCQPVSCAGKRQGDKDERWLWPEFYRSVCEARPRWVLVENVPGLLSAENGRLFGGILGDLARCGYDAEWDLLPAAAFGAPHLRFRIFLVAHTKFNRLERDQSARGKATDLRRRSSEQNSQDRNSNGGNGNKGQIKEVEEGENPEPTGVRSDVANNDHERFPFIFGRAAHERLDGGGTFGNSGWWAVEPDMGRVAHGIPKRVDRLKCLGNAVVPQVAEWIGRRIMEVANGY